MLRLLISMTIPLGALVLLWCAFRRRAPAGAEPPLAEREDQGGRRAAAQVRHRLRGIEAGEAAQAADIVGSALRRLTASQRERVRAVVEEAATTWRRSDELADQ